MLQLNSKNIPYQSVQVFLSLVSKSSDIATKTLFLYFLLLLALLGCIVECCISQEWLNRYF